MANDSNNINNDLYKDAIEGLDAFRDHMNETLDAMENKFRESIGAIGRDLTDAEESQLRSSQRNAEEVFSSTVNRYRSISETERELREDTKKALNELNKAKEELYKAQQTKDKGKIKEATALYSTASSNYNTSQQRQQEFDNIGNNVGVPFGQKVPGIINTASNIFQGSGVTGLEGVADLAIGGASKLATAIGGPIAGGIVKAVGGAVKGLADMYLKQFQKLNQILETRIQEASNNLKSYTSAVNTRLQGTDMNYDKLVQKIIDTTGNDQDFRNKFLQMADKVANAEEEDESYVGPLIGTYVSAILDRAELSQNIGKLAEKGISYNIEERAVLMTLSDKIATTFESLNDNLNRLIRIQQEDVTRSALASEASITNFLNTYYNDSSYMSDQYDTVTANILEATSQMNVNQATSFSYAVQKWLGALYSVGLSSEAVDMISKGLDYLSTGNISQLQGSSQTLMAMAAERAGISYSDILTRGMDDKTVDTLMTAMVTYLSEISNNTSSQVVKSQWSEIFGVSMSDLRAIANLNHEDLVNLNATANLNKAAAEEELLSQFSKIFSRMSTQELLDTVVNNIAFGKGMSIAMDFDKYSDWFIQQYEEERAMDNIFTKAKFFFKDLFRLKGEKGASDLDILKAVSNDLANQMNTLNLAAYLDANPSDSAFAAGQFINSQLSGMSPEEYILTYLFSGGSYQGLKLSDWGGSEFNKHNRGEAFSGLNTSLRTVANIDDILSRTSQSVITGTSSSMTATLSDMSSTMSNAMDVALANSDVTVKSFSDVEQQVQSSNQVITSQNEEVLSTIDKLYSMLFEDQTTPLKVQIEGGSEDFNKFLYTLIGSNLEDLSKDIDRYISNSSNYVDNLTRALYSIRGM